MAGSKILKKLTIRSAVGSKQEILAYAMTGQTVSKTAEGKDVRSSKGSDVPLLRILGQVVGFKAGASDYGSYVELRGTFVATNLQTGEVTDGVSRCILPDAIGEPLANAIHTGAEAVEFAVEIYVSFNEDAAVMYEFNARNLLPASTPQPVQALMDRMATLGIKMTEPLKLTAPVLSDADKQAQAAASKKADETKAAAEAAAAAKTAEAAKGKGKQTAAATK